MKKFLHIFLIFEDPQAEFAKIKEKESEKTNQRK